MIRGPFVYKGTRPASCKIDGKRLAVGDSYYLVTGYGHGNVSTLHDRCISTELKLEATQKEVVACQNQSCRKLVLSDEMRRLKKCPECGAKVSSQYLLMVENNLLAPTKLVVRKGKLERVPN